MARPEDQLPPLAGQSPVPAASADEETPSASPWRGITLLCASALTIMAGAIISPSLPALEARFAGEEDAALLTRLVLTMPALFIALCAPLAGIIADRVGRRPLLIGSVLLYGIAGQSGLVLDTLHGLLAGRALLGISMAGIMTATTTLAGDYFTGRAREQFMGRQMAFTGFGGLLFLTAGGILAEIHWRAPFAVYSLALILLPAILVAISEPPAKAKGQGGNSSDAQATSSDGFAWGWLVLLLTMAALNSIAFYTVPTQLPFFLKFLGVRDATWSGIAIGMANLVSAFVALNYSRIRSYFSNWTIFGIAFSILACSFGLLAVAESFSAVMAAMVISGLGLGLLMPNFTTTTMNQAPPAVRGRMAGALTASFFIGHFISPFVSQPAIQSYGFAVAYGGTGVLLAGMAVVSLMASRAQKRSAALEAA